MVQIKTKIYKIIQYKILFLPIIIIGSIIIYLYGATIVFASVGTQVSVGSSTACTILSSSMDCWGYNSNGQLGNGTTTNSSTPVAVSGISTATEVSAGGYYSTCARLSSGSVQCWGYNTFGGLGNGTTTNSSTPVTVSGISTATEVATGQFSACARLSSGSVQCWGANTYGGLGNGTTTNSSTPVTVSGISTATHVSMGLWTACAVLSSGSVQCWGYNAYGELGNGTTTNSSTPVTVSGISTATQVSISNYTTCARLSSGSVQCWGYNPYGGLGNGTTTNSSTPVTVQTISTATQVSAGFLSTCALLSSGALQCWGYNGYGQLGNGTTTNSSVPVTVSGISTATQVSAGDNFACALLSSGALQCWGYNTYGQLGNGTTTQSLTPVFVSGFSPPAPTVSTTASAGYSYNYFYASGTLNNNNTSTVQYGFRYGTTNTSCSSLSSVIGNYTTTASSSTQSFNGYISANASTTYYYCIYAYDTSVSSYVYGSVVSVTTQAPPAPALAYSQSSAIDDVSAKVGWGVVTYGYASTAVIRYGTSNVACGSLPSVTSSFNVLVDNGNYFANTTRLTGLSPSTPYYWCMVATSANGSTSSSVGSFTTTASAGTGCDLLPSSTLATSTDKTTIAGYLGTSKFAGTLLYRASTNGWTAANFHTAVDNQGENIVLIKNGGNNKIFGGYDPVTWDSSSGYKTGTNAFLFSLSDGYKLNQLMSVYSTYNGSSYGPIFGGNQDLSMGASPLNAAGVNYTNPGQQYENPNTKGAFTYLDGGGGSPSAYNFTPSEIEVYKLSVCTASAPTVTTPTSASIGGTSATLGANVTSAGTQSITARGICYAVTSTNSNPQSGGTGVTCTPQGGTTTGVFTLAISGLQGNTGYSFTGYATNSVGTGYTSAGTFTTLNLSPTSVTTNAQTNLNSYYVTLQGSANPNGYATTGHFRLFTSNPGNCTSDTGGYRTPALSSNDPVVGSDSVSHNFSYTTTFGNPFYLSPNTNYWYCAYASGNGTTGGSSVVAFTTPDGPASPCDPPISGNLTIPAGAGCGITSSTDTQDGVDVVGSGNTNTGQITISGTVLTVGPSQTLARGSLSINGGGSLTLGAGASVVKGGIYVHDADGDGVLDDSSRYIGNSPPAGYVRRSAFAAIGTNSTTYNYMAKLLAVATFDCNPTNANIYQNVTNLVKDADNDGYKTSAAAATQCVGGTSVINGRTYYKDSTGAYTWMNAGSSLGTDCDDTNANVLACSATQASMGANSACSLLSSGSAQCWGSNVYGQLGNGTTTQSTTPVTVSGITTATQASMGGYSACSLLSSGSVQCWGDNQYGQLGNGTTTDSLTPVTVSGITTATQISVGEYSACAVLSSGSVQCWGHNDFGELGNGSLYDSSAPVTVSGITTATQVSIGNISTCARLSSGSVQCWGDNGYGELGNGTTTQSTTPVTVSGITTATQVSTGGIYPSACALLSSGSVQCWGYGGFGELGNGTTSQSSTPVTVSGITTATQVSDGDLFACARLSSSSVQCWGYNGNGQLGNNSLYNSSTPVTVSGITTATQVSGGGYSTCARLSSSSVQCWGQNSSGQLGNGTTTDSSTPVTVSGY